jgi:hypothetical protein
LSTGATDVRLAPSPARGRVREAISRSGYLPHPLGFSAAVAPWLLVATMLAIADAVTTYVAIRNGTGQEANPVMARLIGRIGLGPALLLRATALGPGCMGIVALFASCRRRLLRRGAFTLVVVGVVLWSAAVANNLWLLGR